MQYRNVIIGTGFAAHYVASQLPVEETLMVQPFSEAGDILEILASPESIFEFSQVSKTKSFGGGIAIWGGAISYPNEKNYLKKTLNSKWNLVCEELLVQAPESIWGLSSATSETLEKIFPGAQRSLEIEKHGYITGQFGEVGQYQFPGADRNEIFEGALIAVRKMNSQAYELKLIARDSSVAVIETQNLVFATGNFLNACYTSLLTKINRFPVGNHCSKKIGDLLFNEPMSLTNIAQTYDTAEYQFVTLGNNGFSSNFQRTANSIRLQVTDTISVRRAAFDFMIKDFFKSGMKVKFRTLHAILTAAIRGTRLISRATVRMMTDQPADESSNYFEITEAKDGKWTSRVKLELDSKVSRDSEVLIQTLNQSLEQSRYIKKGTRLSLRDNFPAPENIWRDAGHYYGSVPVGLLNSYKATVDENLQLNGFTNTFVIGASCFPIGSHGHPTKLIMDLATRLGKHISEKNE
jgi:hypothetical protein